MYNVKILYSRYLFSHKNSVVDVWQGPIRNTLYVVSSFMNLRLFPLIWFKCTLHLYWWNPLKFLLETFRLWASRDAGMLEEKPLKSCFYRIFKTSKTHTIRLDLKNCLFGVTRPWVCRSSRVGRSWFFFIWWRSVLFPGPYCFSIETWSREKKPLSATIDIIGSY